MEMGVGTVVGGHVAGVRLEWHFRRVVWEVMLGFHFESCLLQSRPDQGDDEDCDVVKEFGHRLSRLMAEGLSVCCGGVELKDQAQGHN